MEDNDRIEASLVGELAHQYPALLTFDELRLRMKDRLLADEAETDDAIRVAMLELERDGLVRVVAGEYTLTRAAARMAEFPDG